MLNKTEYHPKVSKLVPCLTHANHLAQYLHYFQSELETEKSKTGDIEYLNFLERSINGYIASSNNPDLTDFQFEGFCKVQTKTLEFLSE